MIGRIVDFIKSRIRKHYNLILNTYLPQLKKNNWFLKALTARILTATTNKFSVYAVALLSSKAFSDCRRFVSVAPFAPVTEYNERQKKL